ncbi:MAG: T9SS type A sorting domain-containing protein, partial [Pedobacter sp.]
NQAPVSRAGLDMLIALPVNKVIVDGSASSDADGYIAKYQWSKISGPAQFSIAKPTNAVTEISGLAEGIYVFRLTVTDDKGLSHSDDLTVAVKAAGTQQPKPEPETQQPDKTGALRVDAGADMNVVLPVNHTMLSGSATGGNIVSYRWTKVSGPARYNLVTNTTPATYLQDLAPGTFVFRLTVIDDQGRTAYDDITINVGSSLARIEQPLTLNAGVWPNPSSGAFNLNLLSNADSQITVKIHNQWGQVVKTVNGVRNNSTIALGSDLTKGQYFIIVEQGGLKKIIKIIKL